MSQPLRIFVALVLIGASFGASRLVVGAPVDPVAPVKAADLGAVRSEPLRFEASVGAADQQVVLTALAGAQPEARSLIDAVDGLVVFGVGRTSGDTLGVTESRGNRDFRVTVDLDRVYAGHGVRGIARVVLHEFGHVVDHALVGAELKRTLDAGIPHGYQCEPGQPTGSCAPREERFAESFAKWAMNDIGVDIYIGYMVPPPAMALQEWGRPLAALAL